MLNTIFQHQMLNFFAVTQNILENSNWVFSMKIELHQRKKKQKFGN